MTQHTRCPICDPERLSAFAEGDLSPAETQSVRAHAADCGGCADVLADLALVVTATRGVDRPEPPPTLWGAIEGALDRAERRDRWRLRLVLVLPSWRAFGTGALAGAAAVALVVVGLPTARERLAAMRAGPATAALAQGSPGAPPAPPDPLLDEAEAEFAAAAAAYERSIGKLRDLLARQEPGWSDGERTRYVERLARLDESITRSRELAHRTPGDSAGNEQLFAAYQQKIAFLTATVHRGAAWEGDAR